MVGPMLLLKMLHCKRMNGLNRDVGDASAVEGPSQSSKDENIRETNASAKVDEDKVCRVCLQEGTIPIFGNDNAQNISEALNTFGNIDVRIEDPYPKFLCQSCNSLLEGAMLFRKTAQETDEILKKPIEDGQDNINDEEILESTDDDMPLKYIDKEKEKKKIAVYRCRKCNLTFDSFKELNDHRMSEEHENMRHTCPFCHKSYAPLYFKKHLALHTKHASYVCEVCGKNFILQGHFTRHRLTHFYQLPFKCSLCPYRGRFRESLKMHMRSHTGEKPYQCTECPSRFINKSNLNKHLLTHKDVPDFVCDGCGRRFYTKRDVDQHYKVEHTGIRDHICKSCGKCFGYRKHLMKHELKVHKREKMRSGRTPLYLKVETMQKQGQKIATEG